ncbi:MAG: methylmalonyl Co-A mutase-associated GTPase MeaB [Bacteroidota bacterium]
MSVRKHRAVKSISKIKERRKNVPSAMELVQGIFRGNKTALARAITLVESAHPEHLKKSNQILEQCLTQKKDTIRLGITGVPGVGKSTFIEAFGQELTQLGNQVAVLAVDPTSSVSSGSILGDKTRMEELVNDPNAFIRPSPSGDSLGGVARKTRETIILCEAAGYNIILIETVGVGQSETTVHGMVDFFLLLKLAGAGDELQGMKRGIMEMADAIVINKADGDNVKRAQMAKGEFARAIHLFPPKANGWTPKVLTSSAIEKEGILEIWEVIQKFMKKVQASGHFLENRQGQNKNWLIQHMNDQIKANFYSDKKVASLLPKTIDRVIQGKVSPFAAADQLIQSYTRPE